MKRIALCIAIAFVTLWSTHAHGQVVGSISGTVLDSTGAVVGGANVTATNQGTNVARSTTSDNAGYFTFTLLPIGTYSVQVSAPGFEAAVQKDIALEGQQNIRLEFKLVIGQVSQSVSVNEEGAEEVQRVDPTLEQTIHAEQVAELPLNGRDFVQLALLAPGTARSEQPGDFLNQGTSSEVSFRGSVSLSVQGMSEAANDWRYDGIDDNELTAGGVGFLPQIDAIQEFNVLTYNYSAQYGSRAGSTVLVSTKSGTNTFHGTLFEFLRNDIFDARNYFNLPGQKSEYRQNEFGGSFGGPIIKNKTFFFGDFQSNRVNQAPPIFATIPTVAQVTNHIFTNPIFDPTTTIGGTTNSRRTSYYNPAIRAYQIPAAEISPVGQAILNIFPAPNVASSSGANNYESTPVRTLRDDEWDFRVDHTISDKDHIFARFSWDDAKQFNPSGLPGLGSGSSYFSTTTFVTHPRNMALSETHIFSPHVVNQVEAGYNKDFNFIRGLGYGTEDGNNIGIPGSNLGDAATSGMPLIAMTGYNPIGDRLYSPYQGGTSIFHYLDSVSITKGNHTIVTGFDFRPMQMNMLGETYFHGYLSFTKNFTAQIAPSFAANITDPVSGITGANGNPIASVLLGYPDNGDRSNQVNSGIIGRRWKEYRGYVQDNWAASQRLTLNLGVAYGVTTPISEAHNRIANFDIKTGNFYVAGNGTTQSANVFLSNKYAGVSTDYSNIEPRFGFSFSPLGAQKTLVIRGGYGIFHDVSHLGVSNGIQQNPPYTNTYTFQSDDITPVRTIIPGSPIDGFPNNSAAQNPATYTGSLVAYDKNFKQGIVQQYNFNIQQGLGSGTVLTVAYAGTHGDRMDNNPSYNVATPGTGNNPANRRPFPQYQSIAYTTGNGWIVYNSMQAKIERRTHGLYLLGSYTYAQGIENSFSEGVSGTGGGAYFPLTLYPNIPVSGGNGTTRPAPLNTKDDRGLSSLTLRNDFTASIVYLLPVGRGGRYLKDINRPTDMFIGGWQTNMIFTSHSGYPLYFSQSTNTSGAGVGNRPDYILGCNLYANSKTVKQWVNPACFANPTAQELGNAPRSLGYGPGRTNVDFSLKKNFALFEAQNIEFHAEFFNILNHTQLATPATGFGSATFGTITATVQNNRQIQFALKYVF